MKKYLLLLLLIPSLGFADFLVCKDFNFIPEGKVVSYLHDTYVFEVTKPKILITYEPDQCKIYKTEDEVVESFGWRKV